MRKEFAVGTSGTVVGGVILWFLEPHKERFPKWAEAFFDFLWAPVAFPLIIALVFGLLFGFLVFEFLFTMLKAKELSRLQKERVARNDAAEKPSRGFFTAPGPVAELRLPADEETVLAALTQFGDAADARKLLPKTGLTEFRFEHAVGNLNKKFLISDISGYGGRGISFKQTGREYAALHDLDKKK